MKKMLCTLMALSVITTDSALTISCFRNNTSVFDNGVDSDLDSYYKKDYNFVTGPKETSGLTNNKATGNPYMYSFVADAKSLYSIYSNATDSNGLASFYGNRDRMFYTPNLKGSINMWKNETKYYKMILLPKKEISNYQNISFSTDAPKGIEVSANFSRFLLTTKHNTPIIDQTLLNEKQFIPEGLYGDTLDSFSENIGENKTYFDVWPIVLTFKTNSDVKADNYNIKLNVSFEYNDNGNIVKDTVSNSVKVKVAEKELSFDDTDVNGDGKITDVDRFSFNAEEYPLKSLDYFKDDDLTNLTQLDDVALKNTESSKSVPLKNGETSAYVEYETNGLDIETNVENNTLTIALGKNNITTDGCAVIKLKKDNDVFEYFDFYYNKDGQSLIGAQTNTLPQDNPDGTKWSVDIDGDGDVDEKDVDADGDGIADELGPSPYYGDWMRRDPIRWRDYQDMMKPLVDSNSLSLFATGTHKQMIQYIGRLDNSSYKLDANNDDYEASFKKANESAQGINDFFGQSGWTWDFDFSNLDRYMMMAAKNNMTQMRINPIDVGGYSFWYLKGKNAQYGVQRDVNGKGDMSVINTSTGKISKAGEAFLDYIFPKLVQALSKHLANDIYKNDLYKTKTGQNVKVYFTFDEQNESAVDTAMNIVHKNVVSDGLIYCSYFIGWRSDLSNSNLAQSQIKKDFNNTNFDQLILVYRMFQSNSAFFNIRSQVDARRKRGASTYFYSTWDSYPGAYTQSDLVDEIWEMFLSYKLNMNGYWRWGYDVVYSDYLDTNIIDINEKGEHAAGQSYLVYGGANSTGVAQTTRMLMYQEAVEYVYKFKILQSSSELTAGEKLNLNIALGSIGLPSVYYQNNDYKWNLSNDLSQNSFAFATNNYDVTSSEQVYCLMNLIDKKGVI